MGLIWSSVSLGEAFRLSPGFQPRVTPDRWLEHPNGQVGKAKAGTEPRHYVRLGAGSFNSVQR
jgi:hypothetical protein